MVDEKHLDCCGPRAADGVRAFFVTLLRWSKPAVVIGFGAVLLVDA
jgi:hypothetical protein